MRHLGGTYEPDLTRLIERHVGGGDVLFDLGANLGHFTLLASHLVGPTGRVVAVEADGALVRFLRRHVEMNSAGNVVIVPAAVGGRNGLAGFEAGSGSGTGRVASTAALIVPMMTLESLCAEVGAEPTRIKIDVEGSELSVLQGGRELIRRRRPMIFLSVHGDRMRTNCTELLASLDYELTAVRPGNIAAADEFLCRPRG